MMDAQTSTSGGEQPKRLRLLADSPRFADSFGLVLLLLVVSFFVIAAAGDGNPGRIASMIIFAATTWLALRAAQVKRRILRIALALIPLATLAAIILVLVGNDETATIVSKMLTVLLVVVAPVAILKRLVAHPVISLNTFYGAVCVYLMIAMFFATTYGLIALISGEQFFVQLTVAPKDTPAIDYLYFSFVTITTTGYGPHRRDRRRADDGRARGDLRPAVPDHRRRAGRPEPRPAQPHGPQDGGAAGADRPGRAAGRPAGRHACLRPPTPTPCLRRRLPSTPTPEPRRRPRRPVAHGLRHHSSPPAAHVLSRDQHVQAYAENTIVFLSVRADVPHRNLHTRRRGHRSPERHHHARIVTLAVRTESA